MRKYTVRVWLKTDPENPIVHTGITYFIFIGGMLTVAIDHTEVAGEDREVIAQYRGDDMEKWTKERESEPEEEVADEPG